MIIGHHHVSFTVANLRVTEEFFAEVLGFRRVGGGRYDFPYIASQVGYPDAVLDIALLTRNGEPFDSTGFMIELSSTCTLAASPRTRQPAARARRIFAFWWTICRPNTERMKALGVTFVSPPNEVTYGVNKGAWAVYFKGPDDIRLELIQPRERARKCLYRHSEARPPHAPQEKDCLTGNPADAILDRRLSFREGIPMMRRMIVTAVQGLLLTVSQPRSRPRNDHRNDCGSESGSDGRGECNGCERGHRRRAFCHYQRHRGIHGSFALTWRLQSTPLSGRQDSSAQLSRTSSCGWTRKCAMTSPCSSGRPRSR